MYSDKQIYNCINNNKLTIILKHIVKNNIKILVTHNGKFHCDEVISSGILQNLFNLKLLRTRNKKLIEVSYMKIDVGKKYNPDKFMFDHHQDNFNEKYYESCSTNMSTAGLIWKHYGKLYIKKNFNYDITNDELLIIYKSIIEEIDCNDNGVKFKNYNKNNLHFYVNLLNHKNHNDDYNQHKSFIKAQRILMELFDLLLLKKINYFRYIINDKNKIKKCMEKHKQILILEEGIINWRDAFKEIEYDMHNKSEYLYLMQRHGTGGEWICKCLPSKNGKKRNRIYFPKKEKLKQIFNLMDESPEDYDKKIDKVISYIHPARYLIIFKSKELALKYIDMLLNYKE